MPKIALNKGVLAKERDRLKLFRKVLPSLDLKRMQLTAEFKREQKKLDEQRESLHREKDKTAKRIPMVAYRKVDISGVVKVKDVHVVEENVVGVKLPSLAGIDFNVMAYSFLAKPAWVDSAVEAIKELVGMTVAIRIAERRVHALDRAVRRITQRVNLFEKILIPNAMKNIQRIQIYLGDAERAAIVRSKLAKAMRAEERQELMGDGL
jgi:V/A-type H+-transporting ATPase subunit D